MADAREDAARMGATPLAVAAIALLVSTAAWCAAALASVDLPFQVAWGFPLVGTLIAAYACGRASRATGLPPAGRRFWRYIAAAMTVLFLAALSNANDAVNGAVTASPRISSLTLALYLLAVLVVLCGLIRLPASNSPTPAERQRFYLDATIVIITSGLFLWYGLFRDMRRWMAFTGSPVTIFGLVLIASVAILTFCKLGLNGIGAVDRRAMQIMAIAALAGSAGGACAPVLRDQLGLANAMLTLPIAAAITVFAAERQRRFAASGSDRDIQGPGPAPDQDTNGQRDSTEPVRLVPPHGGRAGFRHAQLSLVRQRPYTLVPYAAVAATDALLIATVNNGGWEALVVAIGAVVLTGIVVYRQLHALTENLLLARWVDRHAIMLEDAQRQLAHRAHYDPLTGLPNRQLFVHQVEQALDNASHACVVLIDLDDFKTINDRLGLSTGDALLVVVGRRLASCVRADDTVARLGGDEFALLLRDVSTSHMSNVLERVTGALSKPISVDEHELLVQSSIGIAEASSGADPVELLRRADLAMYAAKERGKGRYVRYEPVLDQQAANDAMLGAELRRALDRGDFCLMYQPLVQLPSGKPVGAEALVRWQHPERGVIRPDLFIAAAERTGLIVSIGDWILEEACRQASEWLRTFGSHQDWHISVNISARQLREPGFAQKVAAALTAASLPAHRLMVEVTETAVFDNERAVAGLTEISALGVLVALDDFGTGHSSLRLLRTTPVNILKVDKSFIDGITGGSEEAVIATALIQIADGLHLGAVAEGVETLAQAERLYELGYRLAQGFYFAKPLPAVQVGTMLAGQVEPVSDARRAEAAV